jgi:hypothetical protein
MRPRSSASPDLKTRTNLLAIQDMPGVSLSIGQLHTRTSVVTIVLLASGPHLLGLHSRVGLVSCAHHLPPSDLLRLPLGAGNFPILTPRHFTYFVSCQIYDAGIFIDISPLVFSVSSPPLAQIYFHMKRCLTENKAPAGKKSNTFLLFFFRLYNFIATTERFLFLLFTFKGL